MDALVTGHRPSGAGQVTLRVVSYNILDGGGERLPLIGDAIQALRPDAVALLEASSLQNAERLAAERGMDLVYGEANSEWSIAWLSRLPVTGSRNHRLPVLAKTLLEIEVAWEGLVLSLFATHLVHGRSEGDGRRRADEVRAILQVMGALGSRPHLLVGDFNAVHPDDSVGDPPSGTVVGDVARLPIQLLLDAGYVDCFRRLHPADQGYTYTSSHPWLRLDYAFASPSLSDRLIGCGLAVDSPTERASDHRPIWVDLEVLTSPLPGSEKRCV